MPIIAQTVGSGPRHSSRDTARMHEEIDDDDLPETAQDAEQLRAIVPLSAAGRRFDQALADLFPDYSRSRLSEWIKSGDALLDGAVRRPRDPVRGGETVT